LRQAGEAARARHFAGRVGARIEVVVETETTARCPDYAPVALQAPGRPGEMVPVDIVGASAEHLIGAPAA
jgi:tRNA A37 methylthiotransferase MiaB